jgi:hypothetical protein
MSPVFSIWKNEPTAIRAMRGMCIKMRECAAMCGEKGSLKNEPTATRGHTVSEFTCPWHLMILRIRDVP